MNRAAWAMALALLPGCGGGLVVVDDAGAPDAAPACVPDAGIPCCTTDAECGGPHICALLLCEDDGTCGGGFFPPGVICSDDAGAGHCDGHGICVPGGCNTADDCGPAVLCHVLACEHAACVNGLALPGTSCGTDGMTCNAMGDCVP